VVGQKEAHKANLKIVTKLAEVRHKFERAGKKPCPYREFCIEGKNCLNWNTHSDEEKAFFNAIGGKNPFKLQKYTQCKNPKCTTQKIKSLCNYLHSGEHALCKVCLGTPCIAACGPEYERPILTVTDAKYVDLMARKYIASK